MKRAHAALALLSVWTLLPRFAAAQGFGCSEGGYGTSYGVTPMGFMAQGDGFPYTAMALYQQQMIYQQQQSAQQTRPAGGSLDRSSRFDSTMDTSGSTTRPVALSTNKKSRKKRATSTASKSTTSKNTSAGSTTTDTAKKKAPRRTTSPRPTDASTSSLIGANPSPRLSLSD
jgi:hypothetical protein